MLYIADLGFFRRGYGAAEDHFLHSLKKHVSLFLELGTASSP